MNESFFMALDTMMRIFWMMMIKRALLATSLWGSSLHLSDPDSDVCVLSFLSQPVMTVWNGVLDPNLPGSDPYLFATGQLTRAEPQRSLLNDDRPFKTTMTNLVGWLGWVFPSMVGAAQSWDSPAKTGELIKNTQEPKKLIVCVHPTLSMILGWRSLLLHSSALWPT